MANADDPLHATDVTERAAAVRALAERGGLEDALRLVEVALADRSPSVRLHAAGAAAEIAQRTRPDRQGQAQILERIGRMDPGFNPSLLLLFADAADAGGVERIGRLLRDPRSDVRSGAVAALKRLVQRGHPGAEEAVRGWLADGRHPADTVGEMVRMASEAGWVNMDEVFRQAAGRGRAAAVAVDEALTWSVSRRDPLSWTGLWAELDEDEVRVVDWLYLEGGQAWGPEGKLGPLQVDEGLGRIEGRPPLVRVRLGRAVEDGPEEAFAFAERRLWRLTPKLLARRVDALEPILQAFPPIALGVARELLPLEGANAIRARILALWRGGALRDADRALTSLTTGDRKLKPELQWIQANVKMGLGEVPAAREALQAALKAAPKKAPWREAAEALLETLPS
jgi:hypothetical protein